MFYDYAKINVKAGNGGNGIVAFRREKYVPMGGPAGGDGGKGGSIILQADEGLNTLIDFRYQTHYKGDRGTHGQGSNMHGKDAPDKILRVPIGTVVRDADTQEILADLTIHGQQVVVAEGGRGGRGNARFVSSTHRAPTMAENGDLGEERWIQLELKLLADVGLIGFPNVGKSTLISRVSAVKPKIADYHFTTITPNLGVVKVEEGKSFVMADIPGLIEGAAEGAGLGHRFLRHTERTRVLIHVLDISGSEGRDPLEDFRKVNIELGKYNPKLLQRPMIIAANKMDIAEDENCLKQLQESLPEYEIFPISAVSGDGLKPLIYRVWELLSTIKAEVGDMAEEAEVKVTKVASQEKFYIEKNAQGIYFVKGADIDKHWNRTQAENEDSLNHYIQVIEAMGVIKKLREAGVKDGDTVWVGGFEFEFLD